MIAVVIVLGLAVSALVWPRVYYVEKGAVGDVIWNSTEAYVFIKVYQYGHTFSYLGYVGEVVREIFPFGASQPEKKRNYAIVLHITPEAIQRYSFDNFDVGDVFAVGKTISAGHFLGEKGPLKWSGTHFEPMEPGEGKKWREGARIIPPGPSYDDIAGWSKRKVDLVSPVKDTEVMIELGGTPATLVFHSGFADHNAFIELSRSEHAPESIWNLSGTPQRVSKASYRHIFENATVSQ
jgi:hypothetical protein